MDHKVREGRPLPIRNPPTAEHGVEQQQSSSRTKHGITRTEGGDKTLRVQQQHNLFGKGIDLAPSKRASMAGATDPYPVLTVLFVCCTRKINCECEIQLAISACSQRQRGYRADIACILPKQASKCISSCVQLTSSSHGIIKPTRHHIYCNCIARCSARFFSVLKNRLSSPLRAVLLTVAPLYVLMHRSIAV